MTMLQSIFAALELGVALMRAHLKTTLTGPMTPAELEATLSAAAQSVPDATDWRASIVDLLKILRLDSSHRARDRLAAELNYAGSHERGTPEMNIWLHQKVMKAVAERKLLTPAKPS